MKSTHERRAAFLTRWESQRNHKFRYAFIHGSLIWGSLIAVFSIFFSSYGEMTPEKIVGIIVISWVCGYFYGLWIFNVSDKRFHEFKKQDVEEAADEKKDPNWYAEVEKANSRETLPG
jgi:hypothetical protein